MSVNGITDVTQAYDNKNTSKATKTTKVAQENSAVNTKQKESEATSAAVYEKTEQTVDKKKIYQKDTATIDRLMAESEKRSSQMRDLVEKMLLKQGQTVNDSTDIYSLLREGKVQVDPETRVQAQADIAEDGYWGVNKTSDRLVSFAMALSGSDPSKADDMIAAVKKGFEAATKAWGGDLPQISKDTLDATIKKLDSWKSSLQSEFTSQAGASKVAE